MDTAKFSYQLESEGFETQGEYPRITVEQYVQIVRILEGKPQLDMSKEYEALRALIDGGSESMTHADALEAVRIWKDAYNTRLRWCDACGEGYIGVCRARDKSNCKMQVK